MPDVSPLVTPSFLVVDADVDNRLMYTVYLESLGAGVHPVATAVDALARLKDGSLPDAVIFDAVNLGMTVPAFCTAVRQIGTPRSPRLILVTGWLLSPDDHASLAQLDVVIHQKPCALEALWTTLRFSVSEGSRPEIT
jgi:CheY-like chemotaxis protein